MEAKKIKINIKNLPIIIELESKETKKNYVLKPNKEKTGIFLNKLEQY